MGAQACRRARPPSLGDPRRRVALVSALVSTLAVALTCSLSLPFLLSLVLSPSPSSSSPSFPHFLLPHYLAPRAPLARYTRAGACGTHTVSTLFDDKMAVVDLPTPRSGSYKVILVSPLPSVGLVFRFVSVSYTSTHYFLFLPVSTMDAVKNLFTSRASRAPARSTGLAAATAATTAVSVDSSGSPGSPGSLQSRFKAQTARLRDIQRAQRPKNTQRAYRPRQKEWRNWSAGLAGNTDGAWVTEDKLCLFLE